MLLPDDDREFPSAIRSQATAWRLSRIWIATPRGRGSEN